MVLVLRTSNAQATPTVLIIPATTKGSPVFPTIPRKLGYPRNVLPVRVNPSSSSRIKPTDSLLIQDTVEMAVAPRFREVPSVKLALPTLPASASRRMVRRPRHVLEFRGRKRLVAALGRFVTPQPGSLLGNRLSVHQVRPAWHAVRAVADSTSKFADICKNGQCAAFNGVPAGGACQSNVECAGYANCLDGTCNDQGFPCVSDDTTQTGPSSECSTGTFTKPVSCNFS